MGGAQNSILDEPLCDPAPFNVCHLRSFNICENIAVTDVSVAWSQSVRIVTQFRFSGLTNVIAQTIYPLPLSVRLSHYNWSRISTDADHFAQSYVCGCIFIPSLPLLLLSSSCKSQVFLIRMHVSHSFRIHSQAQSCIVVFLLCLYSR
jgi:hypothetical protein